MANYPSGVSSFTTKVDGPGNTIQAAHINDLQAEVTAIENALVNGLTIPTTLAVTGNATVGGTLGVTGATSVAALTGTGVLTINGSGPLIHVFNGNGVGSNLIVVRNATDGTSNQSAVWLGNDQVSGRFRLLQTASSYTPSGYYLADAGHVESTGAGGLSVVAQHASGKIRFYTGSSGTSRGEINTAGTFDWVGAINWANGGGTLDSTGVLMATWPTTASAANANVANANYVRLVTSLRSAKTDIIPIPVAEARRVVRGLCGVTYRSLVDEDGRVWPGFVADDVEAVTPDLVMYGPNDKLQSVAYDRVAAYLIPMLQDLDARLSAMEAR